MRILHEIRLRKLFRGLAVILSVSGVLVVVASAAAIRAGNRSDWVVLGFGVLCAAIFGTIACTKSGTGESHSVQSKK